jgi:hypothetical protein
MREGLSQLALVSRFIHLRLSVGAWIVLRLDHGQRAGAWVRASPARAGPAETGHARPRRALAVAGALARQRARSQPRAAGSRGPGRPARASGGLRLRAACAGGAAVWWCAEVRS